MLKKLLFTCFLVFGLSFIAFSQSGRRVTPAAKPTPQVQSASDAVQEPEFSESAPNRPRAINAAPSLRRKENEKAKKEQKKNQTEAPSSAPVNSDAATVSGDDEVLKIDTSLVTIPVSVFDRNGLYIPNLRQTDFKIFEDGQEQEIAYFGTTDKPFTVILMIDTSPSTEYKIEEIQQAAKAFVQQLNDRDQVMVIEFDDNVHVLTELTTDRQKVYKAIERADFGGGTSLYDAVDFSLRKRMSQIEGRKAIVLFTDGVDTTSSKANFDSTLRDAEESEAMIFPIYYNTFLANSGIGRGGVMTTPPTLGLPFPTGGGMGSRGMSSAEYALGRKYLEELAATTGGRVFRPESTPGGLTAAFEGIAEELRRQYSIGYYPEGDAQSGQRKQIKVRVNRPNLVVRSRDSYIVGAASQSKATK